MILIVVFQKRLTGQETPKTSLRLQGCDSKSQRFFWPNAVFVIGIATLRFYCDFCGNSLRLRSCDCQSLAICDCDCVGHQGPGKKECTPPPWHPSFLGLFPDPEVTEQKELWCTPFSWENKGKGVYTIGPERRVYTIEASDPEKEKRTVSTVVVYTFFFSSLKVMGCQLLIRPFLKNEKSAQRGSFWAGYPADIRGSFARISPPKTSVRGPRNPGKKQAFGRGHP